MMMAPPQVVGVLLKKPGQHNNPRAPPLDPQETKIRGELYVEDLNERRIVSIRMGWLWVENTQMRLPLRALNLRQAAPSICQPHVLALGFTLTNSQGDLLATFWADTEPIYWSWVRAIAAELVRQTPFRAQRCLNFLEILTICPRGPLPLPESPTETRRRSRSELRCWLGTASLSNERVADAAVLLDNSRRRARSELRGWSSSNSSDEDLHLAEFRSIQAAMLPKVEATIERRMWGCSESSEGSDDSLPWGGTGCRSSVDSIDSAPSLPEPVDTREQRIQRYKEARRRENEARSRRVLEEDAKRRKARREENNNNMENNTEKAAKASEITGFKEKPDDLPATKSREDNRTIRSVEANMPSGGNSLRPVENTETMKKSILTCDRTKNLTTNTERNEKSGVDSPNNGQSVKPLKPATQTTDPFVRAAETVDAITRRLPPLKVSLDMSQTIVRFREGNAPHRQDNENNNNRNNNSNNRASNNDAKNNNNRDISTRYKAESPPSPCVTRTDSGERRSRARERRNVRERCQISLFHQAPTDNRKTSFLEERKERLSLASTIPVVGEDVLRTSSNSRLIERAALVSNNKEFSHVEKDCRKRDAISLPRITDKMTTLAATATPTPLSIHDASSSPSTCEEDVAKLLARCQRVDHYVPVREKLTLFESLSRLGGRLARSTEDLGRSASKPSPRGKQRARSLHDLNRAARSVPVREMCRFFEGDLKHGASSTSTVPRLHEASSISFAINSNKDSPVSILKNSHHLQEPPPCVRTSSRRKHYQK
ncbi:uncharacterized protein DDB_G0287625-like [Venturia canescens]|uniref:uncharacterized protein DDB_G0287625-like n=1 Tax=Venturia canescens TaxID=32260 RepID=UPI001C9C2906|nr:uncharacterized protein DDB_G0287625-like [Venturia canescens]